MYKINIYLYKLFKRYYLKYRKKVMCYKEEQFEDYKIEHGISYICGIDDGICHENVCTHNFSKYGCMYLKK